ncbi:MAG: immunoglobulin-like domain-containing protein [Bacillus sp. (in: firmicutes)]
MNKYLHGVLSIVLALFLAGCEEKKQDGEESSYGELESTKSTNDYVLSLKVDKDTYRSKQEIELEICYQKGEGVTFGMPYELEKNENGVWRKIPFQSSAAFIEIAIILKANECYKQKVDLDTFDYDFTNGKYRIIKTFTVDGKAVDLAKEFNFSIE